MRFGVLYSISNQFASNACSARLPQERIQIGHLGVWSPFTSFTNDLQNTQQCKPCTNCSLKEVAVALAAGYLTLLVFAACRFSTLRPLILAPLPGSVFALATRFGPSDDFNLYAIDAGTGTLRWKFATGGEVYSSPAVSLSAAFFFRRCLSCGAIGYGHTRHLGVGHSLLSGPSKSSVRAAQ